MHRLSQGHPAAKREDEPSSTRPEACCQTALSSSPGMGTSRLQKAAGAWMTEAGGRESEAGPARLQGVPQVTADLTAACPGRPCSGGWPWGGPLSHTKSWRGKGG